MKLLLLAIVVVGVQSGHVLLKRQVEPSPLEPVVQQLSSAVEQLQGQVQALESKLTQNAEGNCCAMKVAFLAQYSADTATGVASGPYVFDSVILNTGNAYDGTTGTFTAPVSGNYILVLQLFSNQGGDAEHPIVDIKVNGNVLARLGFEEGDDQEDSDSTTVVAHLNAGDMVVVQSDEGQQYHYWGQFHSFFSGILISPDTY